MKEIWKDIKGYEGIYQISNFGRVKSYDSYRSGINGNLKFYKGKILKGIINNVGYLCYDLYKDKKRKNLKAHSLVALNFLIKSKNAQCVNHKDGNKLNNNVKNLEWITFKENVQHAFENRLVVKKGSVVLNLDSGIFHESIREAYRTYNFQFSRSYFEKVLKKKRKNDTSFILA